MTRPAPTLTGPIYYTVLAASLGGFGLFFDIVAPADPPRPQQASRMESVAQRVDPPATRTRSQQADYAALGRAAINRKNPS